MKIAFLIVKDFLRGGGGIEKYTREVGKRLVLRGHDVIVYSTGGSDSPPPSWEGIRIRWMRRLQPHWLEKTAGSFCAAVAARFYDDLPDVFHLHSVAAGAMMPFLRGCDVPCVLQMHGVEWKRSRWGPFGKSMLRIMEKVSFRWSTTVTAVSKEQSDFYSRHYSTPVSFIPTGTEVRDQLPPLHLAALDVVPRKYFFTAVRLVQEKGLHYMIPAFRAVRTDWKLLIAGDAGGDRAYVRHLHQLAAGDQRIRFLGHVSSPLLEELYSNAGAYVQASEMEGMAISVLEAMSFGRCCIASDIPENTAVLENTGLTFRSADIGHLAHRMGQAVGSPDLIEPLGDLARQRVRAQFTWDRVTDLLESLYYDTARVVPEPVH